jgi:DNA-binding response OmpR family regulator
MKNQLEEPTNIALFGLRMMRPRVLVADAKQHIRTFLVRALEELGFVTCECPHVGGLNAVLDAQRPDLIVLGLSAGGGIETCEMLNLLAIKEFAGKILLLGHRVSPLVATVHEFGAARGLAMLPILTTPFDAQKLRYSVAALLLRQTPSPPIAIDEAPHAGLLELLY